MKTTTIALASLLTLLVGCANDASKPSSSGGGAVGGQEPKRTLTTNAIRTRGDVFPTRLVALDLPAPTDRDTIAGSDPASPKKTFDIEHAAEPTVRKDFYRFIDGANPAAATLPIDSPQTARVIVSARDRTANLRTLHIRHVESGQILDRARDAATTRPTITRVHQDDKAVKGTPGAAIAEHAPSPAAIEQLAQHEPGAMEQTFPRRILSIDVPAQAGHVRLELPDEILKSGVVVEVQQPDSIITLGAAPTELNYSLGDVAEVSFTLKNGDAGIDGATFEGQLELPDGERVNGVVFEPKGSGVYVAHVPLQQAETKYIGAWHIHARAHGDVGGVPFERTVETAFGYAPSHARMNAVLDPVVVRGADGLIDEIKVDVEVESAVEDRVGLNATLVTIGSDGQAHAIATAQTGQVVAMGKNVVTLHFQAKDIALAKLDGPFHLRDLSLVSYAFATTEHRIGVALDVTTPAVLAKEIRYPTVLSPAAQDMVDLGLF